VIARVTVLFWQRITSLPTEHRRIGIRIIMIFSK
jgi:hypothetical protein